MTEKKARLLEVQEDLCKVSVGRHEKATHTHLANYI